MKKHLINNNFALIWYGKLVSMVGDRFYTLVLALWVLKKSNSPSIMGLVLIASVLPSFLLSFISGAIVDLSSKKSIMIITDFIRGFLIVGVSIMEMLSILEIHHILIASILVSISNAFFDPAVKALIPDVVDNDDLPKANSLDQLISGISTVLGPLLGAFLVGIIGFFGGFLLNGISFILSAVFEMFIREPAAIKSKSSKSLQDNIKEGFIFIFKDRALLKVVLIIAIIHFAVGSFTLILPFLASSMSSESMMLGLMQCFLGIGLILGSTKLNFRNSRKEIKTLLFNLVAALGGLYSLFGIMKFVNLHLKIPFLLAIIFIGLTVSNAATYWRLILQLKTPSQLRGRVFSIVSIFANISMPIAYGMIGLLLEYLSFSVYLIVLGAALAVIALIWRKSLIFEIIKPKK